MSIYATWIFDEDLFESVSFSQRLDTMIIQIYQKLSVVTTDLQTELEIDSGTSWSDKRLQWN